MSNKFRELKLRGLKDRISKLSDEELLMMVNIKPANYRRRDAVGARMRITQILIDANVDGYRNDVVGYATEELTRRGIPLSPPVTLPQGLQKKGVKGWLLFLCIYLTMIDPLYFIPGTMRLNLNIQTINSNEFHPLNLLPLLYFLIDSASFPSSHNIIGSIYILFGTGLLAFSLYAGIALWTGKHNALKVATTCLLISLAYPIIGFLLVLTEDHSAEANSIILGKNLPSIIWPALWCLYLHMSKRVKATYGQGTNVLTDK